MTERKIIAVVGATGAQGSGLVHAILADPDGGFVARALTRNPESEKARALAAAGAEVVAADIDDQESLAAAFRGAWGAYCVTFFWDHFSAEREMAEARMMAAAARQAGLQHVIWSTLEDTRELVPLEDERMPTLMDHYKVPHFDGKGASDHYFTDEGVPTTFLLTSFYWDNFIHFGMGPAESEGALALTLPMGDSKLPGIAAEDIGRCAYGIFKRSAEFVGRRVGIAGEMLTGEQMAAGFSRLVGRPVRYNEVTPEAYRGFGFPGAEDLGNMFQYKRDFETEFCGARDLALSRRLNPDLQSFDVWLARNKEKIRIG